MKVVQFMNCGAANGPQEATQNRRFPDFRWSSWFLTCAAVKRSVDLTSVHEPESPSLRESRAAGPEKDGACDAIGACCSSRKARPGRYATDPLAARKGVAMSFKSTTYKMHDLHTRAEVSR